MAQQIDPLHPVFDPTDTEGASSSPRMGAVGGVVTLKAAENFKTDSDDKTGLADNEPKAEDNAQREEKEPVKKNDDKEPPDLRLKFPKEKDDDREPKETTERNPFKDSIKGGSDAGDNRSADNAKDIIEEGIRTNAKGEGRSFQELANDQKENPEIRNATGNDHIRNYNDIGYGLTERDPADIVEKGKTEYVKPEDKTWTDYYNDRKQNPDSPREATANEYLESGEDIGTGNTERTIKGHVQNGRSEIFKKVDESFSDLANRTLTPKTEIEQVSDQPSPATKRDVEPKTSIELIESKPAFKEAVHDDIDWNSLNQESQNLFQEKVDKELSKSPETSNAISDNLKDLESISNDSNPALSDKVNGEISKLPEDSKILLNNHETVDWNSLESQDNTDSLTDRIDRAFKLEQEDKDKVRVMEMQEQTFTNDQNQSQDQDMDMDMGGDDGGDSGGDGGF